MQVVILGEESWPNALGGGGLWEDERGAAPLPFFFRLFSFLFSVSPSIKHSLSIFFSTMDWKELTPEGEAGHDRGSTADEKETTNPLGGSGETGGVRIVIDAPHSSLKPPPPVSSLRPTAGKGGGMHKRGRDRSLSSPPSLVPPVIGITQAEEMGADGSQDVTVDLDLEPVDLDGDSDDGSSGKKRGKKKKQDPAKKRQSFDLPRLQISSTSSSAENETKRRTCFNCRIQIDEWMCCDD
eukprot:TRINITY_DN494_c0_g1_i1.p1 TRINITY_DN494_c0_g1~~TRINITY_DN494_c0_g1_i1.p1  ORF type:complete len:239 (-),score=82.90 TRINITY_DN494_c0_g1_i1:472-1188(-)